MEEARALCAAYIVQDMSSVLSPLTITTNTQKGDRPFIPHQHPSLRIICGALGRTRESACTHRAYTQWGQQRSSSTPNAHRV